MANKTINELTPLTPSSTSEFAIYENGSTGKTTLQQVLNSEDFLYADDEEEMTSEVSFESSDTSLTPSSSVSVDLLTGNDSWGQRFAKISQMFKNVRFLFGKLGTTDISNIGNGTVTNAINTVNTNLNTFLNNIAMTTDSKDNISVPTATNTTITSLTLQPGKYIFNAAVNFPFNSSGVRNIHLSFSDNGSSIDRFCQINEPPVTSNSRTTMLNFVYIDTLLVQKTYYLIAWQDSGTTLSVAGGLRAIKIS